MTRSINMDTDRAHHIQRRTCQLISERQCLTYSPEWYECIRQAAREYDEQREEAT